MEKERGFNFQLLIPSKRKYNSVQLFSKLFDEVEKIRCWKVQTNSDNVEKERRLHQNGRTIESLQRTIQELQFCNESLSMKMQEHLDDIENLRNKNNVTKNLCNTLNDTFQRTAEKIQLFESEREETHHLFVENIENIQKMIAEFEILRFQAEADQQEMQKVKEKMLQFEDLQEKYHYEYNVKEEEVAVLQTKLKDKENELQNILLEFSESQKCCRQLQETTNEQHELLKKSQAEQDSLLQELHNAKQCCEETQKNCDAIGALLEQNKEECAINIQNKDSKLEELSRVQQQQAQKLEQSQIKIQELQNALTLETERVKELKDDLSANVKDLERSNTLLEEAAEQSAKKSLELKLLQDDLFAHLQGEITQKEKRIKALEKKLFNLRKNSNKALENQKEISVQQEEHKQLQKPHEEETQRLLNDLESESALASELTDEVGKDKLTAVDAIKNKEETELKCQQKIADMVALMEKHKGHYEQIVGEKDAELVMRKKKETEALAHYKSLELELMSVKTDISQLKLELKTEVTKKSPDLSSNAGVCAKTPKEFSKAQKAPSSKKDHRAEVQKKTKCESEITKTLHGAVPRPKAYRIKTPPSAPDAHWKMATMDLDFKSDSSDQSDILNFAGTPPSAPALKSNILPKVRNPARQKSPENKLKFASMKRMRDAGWTAVTGCDHKKKKNNEKIFA
eukprot:XP_011612054.1 PREDICTED: synaptonemal complex protein 1 [Takifugu rubripes]